MKYTVCTQDKLAWKTFSSLSFQSAGIRRTGYWLDKNFHVLLNILNIDRIWMSICKLYTIVIEEHNVIVRNIYHKLLWAIIQLQLIETDNSDVNPPEKLISDWGILPRKTNRVSLTLKNIAFICNSISAIKDIICPYYYVFFKWCIHVISWLHLNLWPHISMDGQKEGFSFNCIKLTNRKYTKLYSTTSSIVPWRL